MSIHIPLIRYACVFNKNMIGWIFARLIFFQNNKLGEILLTVWLWISISLYQGLYLIGTVKIALPVVSWASFFRSHALFNYIVTCITCCITCIAVQPDKPFCRYIYIYNFFFCTDMIVHVFFTEKKSQNKCTFSRLLRLLGNRLVVVHLVLELQHENHVTFNSF